MANDRGRKAGSARGQTRSELAASAEGSAEGGVASSAEAEALAFRLHSAVLHLLRSLRREDVAMGLPPARASALSVLVFAGPKSLGELAAAEQVRPATMSRIVAGLEAAGLVARERDERDARAIRLTPTAEGRRRLEAGRARRVERLEGLLSELAEGDRALLGRAAELMEGMARER